MLRRGLAIALAAVAGLVSCREESADTVARVGASRLTIQELRSRIPSELTGLDSVEYCRQYIRQWTTDRLLLQRGLEHLPHIAEYEQQVIDYRVNLIGQAYENELIASRMGAVTDDQCRAFYDTTDLELKLDQDIVCGISIKVLPNSSKVAQLRSWLERILRDSNDGMAELDEYCQRHAPYYDNYSATWSPLSRFADNLPVTVVEPGFFLSRKVYEFRDDDYIHLSLVIDFRLVGERPPLEFILADIRELLTHRNWQLQRARLLDELMSEGLRTGEVRIFEQ